MAKKMPDPAVQAATTKTDKGCPEIKPLTRRGYKRLARTEREIGAAEALDAKALLSRPRLQCHNSSAQGLEPT